MPAKWWVTGDPTFAPAPVPNDVSGAAYAVVDGVLWSFGGYSDAWGTTLSEVRSYDPMANAWTLRTALTTADYFYCRAAVIDGVAYMLGAATFVSYNLATGVTTALALPPQGYVYGHDFVAVNGLLYWGLASTAPYVYDPVAATWTAVTPWPGNALANVGSASIERNGLIYVLTDTRLGRYNPASDAWTDLTGPPAAVQQDLAAVGLLNDQLVIAGGYAGGPVAGAARYLFDTDSWTIQPDLPVARSASANGVMHGLLFVMGGEDGAGQVTTASAWGEAPPPNVITHLPVTLNVGWPIEATLSVRLSTALDTAYDTVTPLPVTLSTVASASRDLTVLLSVPLTDADAGTVAGISGVTTTWPSGEPPGTPTTGTRTAHALRHANVSRTAVYGRGPTAQMEIEGEAVLTGGWIDLGFETTLHYVDESPQWWGVRTPALLPSPFAGEVTFDEGVARTSLTTVDPATLLSDHTVQYVLPTVLPAGFPYRATLIENGYTTIAAVNAATDATLAALIGPYGNAIATDGVTAIRGTANFEDGGLLPLDAPLGTGLPTSEDCSPQLAIDASNLPTRLELAEIVVKEAGLDFVAFAPVAAKIPHNETPTTWAEYLAWQVPPDYETAGRSAMEVFTDLVLAGNPWWWIEGTTLFLSATPPELSGGMARSSLIGDADLERSGIAYRIEPAQTEPEPLLADYQEKCADSTPPEEGGTGTFETFTDGEYAWTTEGGSGDDYEEVDHLLRKEAGKVTFESQTTRGWIERGGNLSTLRYFSTVAQAETEHTYHPVCPEALIESSEVIRQRKSQEDLQYSGADLSDEVAEDDPPWSRTEEQMFFDAIPEWYLNRRSQLEQSWHAEGWLRNRVETTREFESMVSQEVRDGAGALTGYNVTLLYRTTTRNETYTPVGNGLWHVATRIKTTEQKPVYEPVNPDAVSGDADFGQVELARVVAAPVTHTYTAVTDQAPPSVSCGDRSPCEEPTCAERAQHDWQVEHLLWDARRLFGQRKKVWTLPAVRVMPEWSVGRSPGSAIVDANPTRTRIPWGYEPGAAVTIAAVTHTSTDAVARSTATIWEVIGG